uniref:Type I interferon 22 n=1 Tax=Xenopus laevis TaxID=8355 RepID=A0A1B1FFV0_XENLA|nr:interferon-like LOC124629387 [Xenopus laevis]ANQ43334.1 type I interferon 22 [Xenopus laevis]
MEPMEEIPPGRFLTLPPIDFTSNISLVGTAATVLDKISGESINLYEKKCHQLGHTKKEWSELTHLDSGGAVDVIDLDFAKAFDTMHHMQRLLSKLRSVGLNKDVYTWIGNWIQDRVQRVVVNGTFSTWSKVLSGVPQGSVLGPLLFNLFINDLGEGVVSNVSVFADDTKLSAQLIPSRMWHLQQDLDKLAIWAAKWQMRFNVDKYKVMHLGCIHLYP